MPSGTPTTPAFAGLTSSSVNLSPRAKDPSGSRPQSPSTIVNSSYQLGAGGMGGLNYIDLSRWEESEVTAWLQSLRLGNHSATFARNDITGAVLLDVDQSALKEMGITSVGDRIRIFTAIKNLRKKCAETELVNRKHLHQQQGEMEYLDNNEISRPTSVSQVTAARRSVSARPPPLHLTQSAQDMPLTPSHASPQTAYNNQGLGLREARGLTSTGQGRAGNLNRSPASMNKTLSDAEALGHKKMNSIGATTSSSSSLSLQQQRLLQHQQLANEHGMLYGRRPSTAIVESSRVGSNSSSPTNTSFQRPSTSDGGNVMTSVQNVNGVPLTPISEASSSAPNTSRNQKSAGGYSVGRGAIGQQGSRPITPGQNSTATPLSAYSTLGNDMSRSAPLSLEDVKRRTIKFIGEDGKTSIVPVSDCRDAFDVLARVLKKFGKPATGNSYTPTAGQSIIEEDLSLFNDDLGDLWGIFATSGEGQTKYLTDNELLAICHAPQPHDPLRERGLTIRRINKMDDSSKRATGKRINKLESFFGEKVQQAGGPGGFANSSTLDDGLMESAQVTTAGRRMNRANTTSILTGLGATPAYSSTRQVNRESRDVAQRTSPSISTHSTSIPRKARNFFGQRPPSELISSHLADYFPATEKRVLERTARKSMYGRPSTSLRSKRDSTWSYAADFDAPPLPRKESADDNQSRLSVEAPSILIGMEGKELSSKRDNKASSSSRGDGTIMEATMIPSASNKSAAPIDDWSSDTLSLPVNKSTVRPLSLRRTSGESSKSRRSLATQLRMARGISGPDELSTSSLSGKGSVLDRSDAASMLTVDEITQEVESRRESMLLAGSGGGWVVDEDGVPIPAPASATRHNSSILESSRRSSGISVDLNSNDKDDDDGERRDVNEAMDRISARSLNADAPGEEMDQHLGDPMAVNRATTSRASSISELRSSIAEQSDEGGEDDDLDSDDEEDISEEEDDEAGGVFQSAAPGKEPIKWIKGALIGAGSFGNVFLGMNAKNGLLMAVKQVELPSGDSHSDQRKKSMLEALEREIELLKTMQHENIVQYLDSYADGSHLNIFLEYVPGGSVVALLRNYGAFEEPLVRKFVKQILHGLNFLHNRDIVHRDIKGANILVDNKSCVKISDFGISKKVESDLLVSARVHRPSLQGSVFWMAPEVVKQTSYTRKADIWSLGCLVVEMISGTHPWANLDQMQALFKIGSHAKPQLPEEISAEAVDFLNKTFELDYNNRPLAEELLQHAFITEEYSVPPA